MEDRPERERRFFDTLADVQGDAWWGNTTKAGQLRQDIRAQMAIENSKMEPGRNILEVGCAAGDFSRRFADTGANIIAIDISPRLITLAEAREKTKRIKYRVGNAESLDFVNDSMDAIVGNAVLHHLNLDKALSEFKRVLKPGGTLFFAEPNMANPHVWLGHHIKFIRKRMQISPDETAFYRCTLEKKLIKAGFIEVRIRPFDFLHPSIPDPLIGIVRRLGDWLQGTVLREIGGSLAVSAQKS
jgi:2-polyprenyl-3-methyl-5-hydroxy-6-metoxy-1,4-benzoquinol methylase